MGLKSGMTSASTSTSSSVKLAASLLADLAGRPGRRPVEAGRPGLAAFLASAPSVVFLAAAFLTAAFLTAAFLAGAFLAAALASAPASAATFTEVLAALLVAAADRAFCTASCSAVNGVLPVAWVIVASISAIRARQASRRHCMAKLLSQGISARTKADFLLGARMYKYPCLFYARPKWAAGAKPILVCLTYWCQCETLYFTTVSAP